jgi:ABC-2 type transport system permease protein
VRGFLAAARVGFTHVFAYRAEVAIQLVSISIVAALNGSLWTVATRGRAAIAGVPAPEMRAYVLFAWIAVSFVATRVNEEIGRRFREGQIATDLLRPMTLQAFWYARDLGRALACLVLQSVPLFVGCLFLFDLPLPHHASTWPITLLSLLLAHATNYGISFLVGVAALPMQNISGLTHLKSTLVSVFSGALIPLELFGPTLRPIVFALPFHAMAHTPASLFLERDVPVTGLLLEQAAWAVALWGLGALAWRAAARTLTVQGG